MSLSRKSFERSTLDENYERPDIVNVRLNRIERQWLEALKLCYNESSDSTALKSAAFMVIKQQHHLEVLQRK